MNLYIHTLGCKVNQYESQAISEIFVNNGFGLSAPSDADVIIVNSCSVTAESDRKTRQTVSIAFSISRVKKRRTI